MRQLLLLGVAICSLVACTSSGEKQKKTKLKRQDYYGETMGTTFKISFRDSVEIDIEQELSDFLNAFNNAVSTYIETSDISKFNQQDSLTLKLEDAQHFLRNYKVAKGVYKATDGWFDPTVMPLVNYWGFGYTEKKQVKAVDTAKVSELLKLVAFDAVRFEKDSLDLPLGEAGKWFAIGF